MPRVCHPNLLKLNEIEFMGFQMYQDTLHEALNRTVYGSGVQHKRIAAELDLTPSQLSRMVGPDNSLNFPFEKIPHLMEVTQNYIILDVMADLSGHELRPKEISPTELVGNLVDAIKQLPSQLEQVMGPVVEALKNGEKQ